MITYELRRRIRWKGRKFREMPGGFFPSTQRGQDLYEKYFLNSAWNRLSVATAEESLGTLDLLDHIPSAWLNSPSNWAASVDVGCKNWRNLPALIGWLRGHSAKTRKITGVEVDAYRVYSDFRTRYSVGMSIAQAWSSRELLCCYQALNFTDYIETYQLAFCLFPFVQKEPHLAWGLPKRLFNPDGFFLHLARGMTLGGVLIMANQGEWEWEAARNQLSPLLKLQGCQELTETLHACRYPIFLSVWRKTGFSNEDPQD